MKVNKEPNMGGGGQTRAEKQEKEEDVTKSCVTDLLSGAESAEIWIKRISHSTHQRLPENQPAADQRMSFSFLSPIAPLAQTRGSSNVLLSFLEDPRPADE